MTSDLKTIQTKPDISIPKYILTAVFIVWAHILLFPLWICMVCFRSLIIWLSQYRQNLGRALTWLDIILQDNFVEEHGGSIILSFHFNQDMDLNLLKKTVTKNVINAKLPSGQPRYIELQQYQSSWMGIKFWKNNPHYHIDNHIRKISFEEACPSGKGLEGMIEGLVCKPYKPNQSPWEMVVVNDCKTENGTKESVLFWRNHHSMADGFSIFALMVNSLGDNDKKPTAPNILLQSTLPQVSLLQIAFQFVYGVCEIFRVYLHNLRFWRRMMKKRKDKVVVRVSSRFRKSLVKEICTRYNVRVPTVLMTLVAESLSKVLKTEKDEVIYISYAIPIPNHSGMLSNHVQQGKVKFPIGRGPSIIEKMFEINEGLLNLRTDPTAWVANYIGSCLGVAFPKTLQFAFEKLICFPIFFTNFAAPTSTMTVVGIPGKHVGGCLAPYRATADSIILILGYKDNIQVTCASNDWFLDGQMTTDLMERMSEEFEKLLRIDSTTS